jgi:hypothetical protein
MPRSETSPKKATNSLLPPLEVLFEKFFLKDGNRPLEIVNVQRAKCRLVEGSPLGELADNPDVIEMMGGRERPPLGVRPFEVLDISATRIGKSLFAACLIFWMSQTVDLSQTARSDIVQIFIVATKLGKCRAVLKHLYMNMVENPALRPFLACDPKELTLDLASKKGLPIRHPSGKIIEVMCVPLDKAGSSGVSVYSAGVVVDEYPRMSGEDDGVKNIDHFREAVLSRLLPGAIFLATGSPWAPYGPAYDMTVKHFGKPTADLLVLRSSARPFLGKVAAWTEKTRDRLERSNPRAYKNDFLAEFFDGDMAVFPEAAIFDAFKRPIEEGEYGKPAIFADPSALRHDYWAAAVGGWVHPVMRPEDEYECEQLGDGITPGNGQVIVGRNGWVRILEDQYGRPIPRRDNKQPRPWFEIYDIVSWDKNSGVSGLDLVKAVSSMARKYGCEDFHWDGYEQLMLGDMIRREGLRPVVHTWSGPGRKTEAVDHLRTLLIERRVRLPQHDKLRNELVRFQSRQTPGGNFSYVVAGGGGHGDHASCLTLAMRADLDGFVDRSPTKGGALKTVILDHSDPDEDY